MVNKGDTDTTFLRAPLSQEIQREYNRLIKELSDLPASSLLLKEIDGTGGKVSVRDLIAYQIGWGKNILRWYEASKRGEIPLMPGDGFSKWDYTAIADHFYQKYQYAHFQRQYEVFEEIVGQILAIVEEEFGTDNLDKAGVWSWCTLPSGKQWPLSKWVRVNTASPYKRAMQMVQKWKKRTRQRPQFEIGC